jgi:membrane peptidoglycan carboxypeptidase
MAVSERKTILATVTHLFQTWHKGQKTLRLAIKGQASPVSLRIYLPGKTPQTIMLRESDLYIGRSERACQITLPVDSVSHVHARLQEMSAKGSFGSWLQSCFGWPRPRYQIVDQDSTNGLYHRRQRKHQLFLYHKSRIFLGPPEDPSTVFFDVSDPPPLGLHLRRFFWTGVTGFVVLAIGSIGQEWHKIQVDPLPASVRGPVMVLARDQQTPLQRDPGDVYRALPVLQDFGPILPKVVVAAEDHRFYFHFGVDLLGTLRALVINFRAGELQQGGSSISQQLARTVLREYTGTDNTLGRKWREALAAMKLEAFYSKDEILTLYLNNVYLGNGIYGFESAAHYYFGSAAMDLDLSQAAMLASILPAPNALNPVVNREAALKGRERVLNRLSELKTFDEKTIQRARRSIIDLKKTEQLSLDANSERFAPYFLTVVIAEMSDLLGSELAAEGNFEVGTTLDPVLQQEAEASLVQTITELGSRYGFSQGAIVTIDSRTGEILALVGGVDYGQSQFNRALAQRQPGSTFKIFPYALALERGFSPDWPTYSCAALNWGGQTFPGCRSGSQPLNLRQGLIQSENVIALRLAQKVGLDPMITLAKKMGIQSPLKPYPSVVLGGMEVTLLELTGSFVPLAHQGIVTKPHTIRYIRDTTDCTPECRMIYPQSPRAQTPVLAPDVAQNMTQILQGVVTSGTGRNAFLGLGEAGKTGTTNSSKDLVFVGYFPNGCVTGIWLGNDDATPTKGSSAQAAQAWKSYMTRILRYPSCHP